MQLSSGDISYLRQKASEKGYNADDLLSIMNYESSGRPDVWGGKGGKYFGLLQFGPSERKQFGVDTVHPSAQNQIDAGLKFLEARGFKPKASRAESVEMFVVCRGYRGPVRDADAPRDPSLPKGTPSAGWK